MFILTLREDCQDFPRVRKHDDKCQDEDKDRRQGESRRQAMCFTVSLPAILHSGRQCAAGSKSFCDMFSVVRERPNCFLNVGRRLLKVFVVCPLHVFVFSLLVLNCGGPKKNKAKRKIQAVLWS